MTTLFNSLDANRTNSFVRSPYGAKNRAGATVDVMMIFLDESDAYGDFPPEPPPYPIDISAYRGTLATKLAIRERAGRLHDLIAKPLMMQIAAPFGDFPNIGFIDMDLFVPFLIRRFPRAFDYKTGMLRAAVSNANEESGLIATTISHVHYVVDTSSSIGPGGNLLEPAIDIFTEWLTTGLPKQIAPRVFLPEEVRVTRSEFANEQWVQAAALALRSYF